jgi:hypothetical protein
LSGLLQENPLQRKPVGVFALRFEKAALHFSLWNFGFIHLKLLRVSAALDFDREITFRANSARRFLAKIPPVADVAQLVEQLIRNQ